MDVENADCPGAQSCVDGQCAEPGVCTQDQDCRANRLCQSGQCEAPCEERGCPAQICDTGHRSHPCQSDDGCFSDRRCIDSACENLAVKVQLRRRTTIR